MAASLTGMVRLLGVCGRGLQGNGKKVIKNLAPRFFSGPQLTFVRNRLEVAEPANVEAVPPSSLKISFFNLFRRGGTCAENLLESSVVYWLREPSC
jgi:hypothetical protein